MSTHCFRRLLGVFLVGTAFSLAGPTPAFADNPNITPSAATPFFELDGNVEVTHGSGLPDDWQRVFSGGLNGNVASTGIVADPPPTAKVFTQGSKDDADISGVPGSWAWRKGSSPAKADIQDAYAVGYNTSSTPPHLITYFGLDRLSVNGTTSAGFWFFVNPVCALSNGTFGQGEVDTGTGLCSDSSAPPAKHAIGDTLVTVEYTTGGVTGTINVFVWKQLPDGSIGLAAPISSVNPRKDLPGLFCAPGSGTNDTSSTVCGITNGENQLFDVPWTPPSGNKAMKAGQFFEGGIDLFALTGGSSCFASFMATSRSSAQLNSETKNFILANFPTCKDSISKACFGVPTFTPGDATHPDLIHPVYHAEIANIGSGSIFDVTIQEDSLFTLSSDASASQCSLTHILVKDAQNNTVLDEDRNVLLVDETNNSNNPPPKVKVLDQLDPGETATLTISCDTSRTSLTNDMQLFAKASSTGSFIASLSHHAKSNECKLTPPALINISKACKTVTLTGGITPQVCVDITVTNQETQRLQIDTLKDSEPPSVPGGTNEVDVLDAFKAQNGGSSILGSNATVTFQRCYTPLSGSSTDPAQDHFDDTVKVTAHGTFDNATTQSSASKQCFLCPQPPQ